MPRFGRRVLISPSQEEVLEAITGLDDTRQAVGGSDETPSQPGYAENSSQSSLERVFDVTGSSLCSGPSQEAVEFVSPTGTKTTRNVALEGRDEEEDSYNEAFESDRSQSPPITVSWSLPAGAHGGKHGPKSTTASTALNAVALEEVDKSPQSASLSLANEVEVSNPRIANSSEAAGVTIQLRVELEVNQEELAAEEDAQKKSGRRGGATFHVANGGAGVGSKTTADGEAQQQVSSGGIGLVCPQGSHLPQGSLTLKSSSVVGEGFGSGSTSAIKSLKAPPPAVAGEHHTVFGLEGATSVRSAGDCVRITNDTLDQIANSVQVNVVQVIDELEMVDNDDSGQEVRSGDECNKKRPRVEHERDTRVRVEGSGACLGRVATCSRASKDELGIQRAATRSGRHYSQPSPPRPPKPVQEKLDKLRSQTETKRARSESFNLLSERLRTEQDMVSSSTVLEAIKLRSGERLAGPVTAADLLKTALAVGITLPPPFHKDYFN